MRRKWYTPNNLLSEEMRTTEKKVAERDMIYEQTGDMSEERKGGFRCSTLQSAGGSEKNEILIHGVAYMRMKDSEINRQ